MSKSNKQMQAFSESFSDKKSTLDAVYAVLVWSFYFGFILYVFSYGQV